MTNRRGKNGSSDRLFLGSKITADGDRSHKIKRHLLCLVKAMVFPVVMYGCEGWTIKKAEELMFLNCGPGEDSWESLGWQGDQTCQSQRKLILNIHWKDWCWSWRSNALATWWEELRHWKSPWCWEGLKAGGEGNYRGWDGRMASPIKRTRVWAYSGRW